MRIRTSPLVALALLSCVSAPPPQPAAPPAAAPSVPAEPAPAEPAPAPQPERVEPPPGAGQAQVDPSEERLRELAKRKIDAGDYPAAIAILGDLHTSPLLARARVLLDENRPEEALVETARAVSVAPGEPRVLVLHGEASLRVGARTASRERYQDALDSFVRAGAGPAASFGASRAARALGRIDEALAFARTGWDAIQHSGSESRVWIEAPEHTLAYALWDAFDAATTPPAPIDAAAEQLGAETKLGLSRWLALQPGDVWAWQHLADVDQRLQRGADELATLEQAFDALPDDAEIAARLDAVARRVGGTPTAIAAFARASARRPEAAAARWFLGLARFDHALERLAERPVAELQAAEAEFAATRARAAARAAECRRHEALCRAAVGWCALAAGELESAAKAFRSMERVTRGGMLEELPGRLESGVRGLEEVAEEHAHRDEAGAAARQYLELKSYQPDVRRWAVRTGRYQRAWAQRLALIAEDCRLAAEGKINDGRRLTTIRERAGIDPAIPFGARLATELRLSAERLEGDAREAYERAYKALLDAWRLDLGDIRVMVDAAVIAMDDLGRDLDQAKALLVRAIELGARQLQDPDLTDSQRAALRAAWADAHEYLGLYYLDHKNEPKRAKQYFEQCLEIGPLPRPAITDDYLPRCEALLRR